jgi:hypothetical protein
MQYSYAKFDAVKDLEQRRGGAGAGGPASATLADAQNWVFAIWSLSGTSSAFFPAFSLPQRRPARSARSSALWLHIESDMQRQDTATQTDPGMYRFGWTRGHGLRGEQV